VAALTGRPDRAPPARDPHLRDHLLESLTACGTQSRPAGLRVFEDGGYTCAKETIGGRRCHVVFDHGPLGFAPLSAHGHADALAIWLTVDDQPVFIDAGTYRYFSGLETRTRLRESLAHNTLAVRGKTHSRAQPAFSWSTQANARLLTVEQGARWSATACHDGYLRAFHVRHVRRVRRVPSGYEITDALEGARQPLSVTLNFLCHPEIELRIVGDRTIEIIVRGRLLCRVLTPRDFTINVERGHSQRDGTACYSGAFGHIAATNQLVLAGMLGSHPETTRIELVAADAFESTRTSNLIDQAMLSILTNAGSPATSDGNAVLAATAGAEGPT
jgi:Heparinase II/III-like protein